MDNSRTCGTCEAPLMMPGGTTSIFDSVQSSPMKNNFLHRTSEISFTELIVRRGQPFDVGVKLTKPFDSKLHPLKIVASTGEYPSEDSGTASTFGIPDTVNQSASAKAVWKVELHKDSDPKSGKLVLSITPPADAPIGEYTLMGWHRDEEKLLAKLVVLFNPWCRDDQVYMENVKEVKEYVLNEQGVLYRGSKNYIMPLDWDLGQFEEDMVKISLKMLDISHKHYENPAKDVASRSDPVYVGRVISAMINSVDDHGVLMGNWGGNYEDGFSPSHWSGSHAILKRWYDSDCKPVKYGQCWVFAGVMCSVMRLLGVPTRTITNFASAHDTNGNLTIDRFHAEEGVTPKRTHDSIWNFHVWTESYMKRPDLSETGKYDGWQVLDPTPQEMSDNVYCCGPASVKAIRDGQVDLRYDCPFVFAEVNADVVEWLVKKDGSQTMIESFPGRVGCNISTKAVGSKKRVDVTDTYKPKEGSDKERAVFKYAVNITTDYSATDGDEELKDEEEEEQMEENNGAEEGEDSVEIEEGAEDEVVKKSHNKNKEAPVPASVPPVVMTFKEVKKDGSQTKIESLPGRVGINTSTKAVGSKKRVDITNTYKPKEGSDKERAVFKYAVNVTTDYSATDDDEELKEEEQEEEQMEENNGAEEGEDSVETEEGAEDEVVEESDNKNEEAPAPAPVPPVVMTFKEVKKDGSQTIIESFPGRVGCNISTKAVGSKKRVDVTDTYKPKEDKERAVFKYAVNVTTDYSATDDDEELKDEEEQMEENNGAEEGEDRVETEEGAEDEVVEESDNKNEEAPAPALVPPVVMTFVEVTHPTNGKDVSLKLTLKSSTARQLSINISVQAMYYNGRPAVNIKHQEMERSLEPGKALSIPIEIPFIIYHEHMINADSMNVSAVVTDMENPEHTYLADDEVVLLDPPISLEIFGKPQVHRRARGEVVFRNPANETLTNCHLTLSGSGLWRDEVEVKIPDLKPNRQARVKFFFFPYKAGEKTAMADFDCNSFRDIKVSCPVKIKK